MLMARSVAFVLVLISLILLLLLLLLILVVRSLTDSKLVEYDIEVVLGHSFVLELLLGDIVLLEDHFDLFGYLLQVERVRDGVEPRDVLVFHLNRS